MEPIVYLVTPVGELKEPDYARAYSLELRRMWNVTSAGFDALQFETMNYEASELLRSRPTPVTYVHNIIAQGHTNRGQLLGSPLGAGAAAGSSINWSRYSATGRTTISLERNVRQEDGTFYYSGVVDPRSNDVSQALKFERVKFLRSIDLTAGGAMVREFDRNFTNDAWNLNATVTARYHLK